MDYVVKRHVHCVKTLVFVTPKMVPVFAHRDLSVLCVTNFVLMVTMDTNAAPSVPVKMAPTVVNLTEDVIVPQVILEPAVPRVVPRVIMGSTANGPVPVTSHSSVTRHSAVYIDPKPKLPK